MQLFSIRVSNALADSSNEKAMHSLRSTGVVLWLNPNNNKSDIFVFSVLINGWV
jgi:hypothetical protein